MLINTCNRVLDNQGRFERRKLLVDPFKNGSFRTRDSPLGVEFPPLLLTLNLFHVQVNNLYLPACCQYFVLQTLPVFQVLQFHALLAHPSPLPPLPANLYQSHTVKSAVYEEGKMVDSRVESES